MLVSIITVSFNAAATIRDTIESVLGQQHVALEYIVVDGGSTDDTISIVNAYGPKISHFISEPDKGIYDAMNKGIQLASGDIIGILNADDVYATDNVLSQIVDRFGSGADAVYADLVYVDQQNTAKIKRIWISGIYTEGAFLRGWMPPHPTFFVRSSVYQQYGGYTLALKSAADYEFMLRVIHKHKIALAYLNTVTTKMRAGGISNASIKNRLNANREDRLAWTMNGLKPGWLTLIKKPLSKLGQFLGH